MSANGFAPAHSTAAISAAPGLYLIPLPQPITGFDAFISAWLITEPHRILIDVGPSGTAPLLIEAIRRLGVTSLDAILLTHIHIDHGGGVGEVAAAFPDAPVVCHSKAIAHLADPTRLWDGSRKTLPDIAHIYGPIAPVPTERLVSVDDFHDLGVRAVPTPGHASHHVSYFQDGRLFAGEAGGVHQALAGDRFWLRPATPPRFFMETHLASVDRLLALDSDVLCYGHFGMSNRPGAMLREHRKQLERWLVEISSIAASVGASGEDLVKLCLDHLLSKDPLLAGWEALTPDARQRETGFLSNSIRGFIGYIDASAD